MVDSVYILPLNCNQIVRKTFNITIPHINPHFFVQSFNAHIYSAISLPRIGVRSIDVQRSAQCSATLKNSAEIDGVALCMF